VEHRDHLHLPSNGIHAPCALGSPPSLATKLNLDQKRARKSAQLLTFVRRYGRKGQRGIEPNDRGYDHNFEHAVKRMPPDELDRLLREDEDS
jgi:hypothetical protein